MAWNWVSFVQGPPFNSTLLRRKWSRALLPCLSLSPENASQCFLALIMLSFFLVLQSKYVHILSSFCDIWGLHALWHLHYSHKAFFKNGTRLHSVWSLCQHVSWMEMSPHGFSLMSAGGLRSGSVHSGFRAAKQVCFSHHFPVQYSERQNYLLKLSFCLFLI